MAFTHERGQAGEALAAAFLEARGWTILARNFRFGHKEIDLVARRGRTVAFVEVKARAVGALGDPLLAITRAKRREIERVAEFWIARHGTRELEYRFDAVAVIWGADEVRVVHVPGARQRE